MAEKQKTSWVYTPKEINTRRGLLYGLTDLMGGGWNNIVSGVIFVFVLSQGISPLFTGAVLGIGRIIDAIWSLFFGAITDRFYRTKLGRKYGRRHFFIALGGILFAILFPMFWISTSSWQYYLWVYVAIEVAISMILIPWETLPTEMTPDYKKERLSQEAECSFRQLGRLLSSLPWLYLNHLTILMPIFIRELLGRLFLSLPSSLLGVQVGNAP